MVNYEFIYSCSSIKYIIKKKKKGLRAGLNVSMFHSLIENLLHAKKKKLKIEENFSRAIPLHRAMAMSYDL